MCEITKKKMISFIQKKLPFKLPEEHQEVFRSIFPSSMNVEVFGRRYMKNTKKLAN
jgi:hypothetical protein